MTRIPPPLLLTGHGTRSAEGVQEFHAFVERTRKRLADEGVDVAGGFIELSAPPLAQAVEELLRQGHWRLVAVPLVLVSAGHGKGDVPGALARERERHPGLTYQYGRPLGPHSTLLSLLESRIDAVLDPADRGDTAVVLVGRGSTDPDANAEVTKITRLLWEGRGFAFVEPAFVSLAWPGVPEVLERARLLGARRVVVTPYFLFPGVLPDRVDAQARGYAAAHPELDVRCANVLGDCDELAGLVVERYREAIIGDIRMNCDTCVYRVALPGFEHRVGAPQAPHHHPHDPAPGMGGAEQPNHRTPASSATRGEERDPREHTLRHHGDAEVEAGLVDLAVNVCLPAPPPWLRERLAAALPDLAAYPTQERARAAVAARHGRCPDEVLLTGGAAEAFVLLARALEPARPVIVHPQFTEPEAALRGCGHPVHRAILPAAGEFALDPASVPPDADLVVLGNPTNPTSVLHPAATIAALARPGRVLVVDEAFMDAVPDEPETAAHRRDLPGLVVIRSLTKTWGLAGLRVGYLLAEPDLVARLAAAQPLWPVSTPALVAAEACSTELARTEAAAMARQTAADRAYLLDGLRGVPEADTIGEPRAPFVLLHVPDGLAVRKALSRRGYAVRRGDTFPGLGRDWLRVGVRGRETTDAFLAALREALG